METWWIICTAWGKSSPTRSHTPFLDESLILPVLEKYYFFYFFDPWNKSIFYRKEKKFLPHAQKHADLCAFPLYVSNCKPYSLILFTSYQYDLFSGGWFEFWCPKAESSLCEYRILKFQSSHVEKPFCYWSCRFLAVFWLLPNLLLAEPFCSNHKRNSHGRLIA